MTAACAHAPATTEFDTGAPGRNVAIAFLAALLLGPFGMAYATRRGAIVMVVVTLLVALPTLGLGVVLTLPGCVLWSVLAAISNGRAA